MVIMSPSLWDPLFIIFIIFIYFASIFYKFVAYDSKLDLKNKLN